MPPPTISAIATRALDLLYPERCVACGRFGKPLCEPCIAELPPATGPGRCPNCSADWPGPGNCPRCIHWRFLAGGLAATTMESRGRHVVHALKYEGVRSLAPVMARLTAPLRDQRPFDVAFAVPLHRSRLRKRGFNQADLLLSELDWPRAPGTLRRLRNTRTQVGLGLGDRRANVRGAFAYEGPTLTGLTVALVDDVITTGATADECAAVLRDYGAREVYAVAFARASHD